MRKRILKAIDSIRMLLIAIVTMAAVSAQAGLFTLTDAERQGLGLPSAIAGIRMLSSAFEEDIAWAESDASAAVRYESREDFGGRLVNGMHPMGAPDGSAVTTWDTTAVADGWRDFEHGGSIVEMAVLNASAITIEGGRLQSGTIVWDDGVTHVVRNWVVVPNGTTLTVTTNAVVKFTSGTGIRVEDGGRLVVTGSADGDVIFTSASDDTAGAVLETGNAADMETWRVTLQSSAATFTDNGFIQTHHTSYPWPASMTLHDATAERSDRVVYVPLTVTGTRTMAFSVDWEAVDGTAKHGEDFTLAGGTISWTGTSQGTKNIEIPLVPTFTGERRSFTVRLTAVRGVTAVQDTATVTIAEYGDAGIAGAVALYTNVVASAPCRIDAAIGTQPFFIHPEEEVGFSTLWQDRVAPEVASVRVSLEELDGRRATTVLHAEAGAVTGCLGLDVSALQVGRYRLRHEVLGENTAVVGTATKDFVVLDPETVVLHGGTLTSNETWRAGVVHVVYLPVTVPPEITLFLEPGAVVKFLTGTGIDVVPGGGAVFANGVIFTHVNDCTVGGDTLFAGALPIPTDAYTLTGNITFGFTQGTEVRYTTRPPVSGTISASTTWARGSVYHVSGNITIPNGVTLTISPGAIVKLGARVSMIVSSGGTLNAVGTRLAPIVFTSVRDDSVGGDTDKDGGANQPQAGDWGELRNNGGTLRLEHVTATYGGYGANNNTGEGIVRNQSGTATLRNCLLRGTILRLLSVQGGTVTAENCILSDGWWGIDGGGTVSFVNGVIDNCLIGATRGTIANTVFNDCTTGVQGAATARYSCFWESGGNTSGVGNIVDEPQFINPNALDFRIPWTSPLADAADATVAPEQDYYGQPRFTLSESAKAGVADTNGVYADIGIFEAMPRNATSDIDLTATFVRGAPEVVRCGESLFVEWETVNVGGAMVSGAWRDTVSLVSEWGQTVSLGEMVVTSAIDAGGTKRHTAYFVVPVLSEGMWRVRVHVNNYRDIFEGSATENNVFTAEESIQVALPAHTPEEGVSGAIFSGLPAAHKFAFDGSGNQIGTVNVPPGARVYYGVGFVPSAESHSGASTGDGGGFMFAVPEGATEVYVVVETDSGQWQNYAITFREGMMAIASVMPSQIPSSGTTSITLQGAGFTPDTMVTFVGGSGTVQPLAVRKVSAEMFIATVDCARFTAGQTYAARVQGANDFAQLPNAVNVNGAAGSAKLELMTEMPSAVRNGRLFSFRVSCKNTGNVDMACPMVTVTDANATESNHLTFSLDGEVFVPHSMKFISKDERGGFTGIRPGETAVTIVECLVPSSGGVGIAVKANTATDEMAPHTTEVDAYLPEGAVEAMMASRESEGVQSLARLRALLGANNGEMIANLAAVADEYHSQYGMFGRGPQQVDDLIYAGMRLIAEKEETNVPVVSPMQISETGGEMTMQAASSLADGLYYYIGGWEAPSLSSSDGIDFAGKKVAVIAHGFRDRIGSGWMADMANALVFAGGFDCVVGINWESDAAAAPSVGFDSFIPIIGTTPYLANLWRLSGVADKTATMLRSKNIAGASDTVFIGHSLGSHLTAMVASRLEKGIGGVKVKRHIGLDTAGYGADFFSGISKNCAIRTEFYKTGNALSFDKTYAHENYIVSQTDDLDTFSPIESHSYACNWFVSTISNGEVGFKSQGIPHEEMKRGGYIGVINRNKFECIYPYEDAKYDRAKFRYSGNKGTWNSMVKAWTEAVDLCITEETVSLQRHTVLVTGVQVPVGVLIKDNVDIMTVTEKTRLASKSTKMSVVSVLLKDTSTGTTTHLGTQENLLSKFGAEVNIQIPHNVLSVDQKEMQLIIQSDITDLSGTKLNVDLYSPDNTTTIPVMVKRGTSPIASINGETGDGFVLSHPIYYETTKDFMNAVRTGQMSTFTFDSSKSMVGANRTLTSRMWLDGSTGVTYLMPISATMHRSYPITLTIQDDMGEADTVSGKLQVNIVINGEKDDIPVPQAYDPNMMTGPLGVGDPDTERFVTPGQWMNYTIYFENMTNATAAAQEVQMEHQMSQWLDWATFEMGEVVFHNQIDMGLAGKNHGTSEVQMTGTNYNVRTTLSVDGDTGKVFWYLRIVDPATVSGWPTDPYAGFLPPNDPETFVGEGHVSFRVKLRDDAPSGVLIPAKADIQFDYNEWMSTDDFDGSWWNTVMAGVTLDAGEGSMADGVLKPMDDIYGTLPAASRNGYAFGGWWTEADGQGRRISSFDAVDRGITTLHAKWTPVPGAVNGKSYKLTVKGGTPASGTYASGDSVTVTADAPGAGQVFANWSGAVSLASSSASPLPFLMPPANLTLTANYAPAGAVLVSYHIGEGVGLGTVTLSPASGVVAVDAKGNRKAVTLTAKPIKDAVFVGWTGEDGGAYPPTSIKVTPSVSAVYTARFRLKADVLAPTVATSSFTGDPWADLMAGVPFAAQVVVPDEMLPVKFTGKALPAGLKLNAASGEIAGVPTKAGNYATVFTVASVANTKAIAAVSQPLTVAPLNPRALGTWQGYLTDGAGGVGGLLNAFTVSAAGKVSAKVATTNGAVSFSGASWGARVGEVFTFTNATKKGESLSLTVDASRGWDEMQLDGTLQTASGAFAVTGQRNTAAVKTDPDTAATAVWLDVQGGYYTLAFQCAPDGIIDIGLAGNSPSGYGYAGVTVGGKTPAPTAKVVGKLADGTALTGSFPVLNSGGGILLPLYAAPYKTGLFAGSIDGDGAGALGGTAVWSYPGKSPAAKPPQTEDRFTLRLGVLGGWYGTWAGIEGHYTNQLLRLGEYVVPVDRDAKGSLTIGKGGANTNSATLTVTPATGVFKGKSDVWPAAAVKPISVSYEGILTPFGEDGCLGLGFYLLNGAWTSGDVKPVSYPIKRSLPVMIEGD